MAKETPLQAMKRQYGTKDKLIDSIADSARVGDEDKSDAVERLKSVSNAKLLRMAEVHKAVEEYGGRDKMVAALGKALGRSKDKDYLDKLSSLSTADLLDRTRAATRRSSSN